MQILKKTDLTAVRDANIRIVKNKENSGCDISRASHIIVRLKEIELKTGSEINVRQLKPSVNLDVEERLVDSLDHVSRLRVVG